MKIYINDKTNGWILQKVEILPTNAPTLDETLETFSFALISTQKSLGASKIAPMQKVKVEFENDTHDVAYFYIVSDSVEVYSTNPVRYKHNISCIQNTRELSKHVVRNSVFSQPAQPLKEGFNSSLFGYNFNQDEFRNLGSFVFPQYALNVYSIPLILDIHEKVKNVKVCFELKVGNLNVPNPSDFTNASFTWDETPEDIGDLNFNGLTPTTPSDCIGYRYKAGGQTHQDVLPLDTLGLVDFKYNKYLDCPFLRDVINNNNATEIELIFLKTPIQCSGYSTDMAGDFTVIDGCVGCYTMKLKIQAETYYHNCYELLEQLIIRQRKEYKVSGQTVREDALFLLPPQESELGTLLINTVAPNFTFTQLTMYECVAEVFRLFDAIFTMDETGVLGIEYFNDLKGDVITPKLTGKNESISEDKYTNGLVVGYQDARIKESFPSKDIFGHLRCDHPGVPEEGEHYLITPHKIQSVSKLETKGKINGHIYFSGHLELPSLNEIVIDLSRFIVNADLWNVLDSGMEGSNITDPTQLYQINAVYFQEGDNRIQVAFNEKIWHTTKYSINYAYQCAIWLLVGANVIVNPLLAPAWDEIVLRCTYIATIDGRAKEESIENKYEGETLVDQVNGAVDLNKLGLNTLGLSLKLGQPTLNGTHTITSWDKRVKVGQLYYDEKGDLWVANVCSYTIFGNGYLQGQISFVKNFNQLALRTQLLREKRMSNISQELVTKSEEIITEYCYYSATPFNDSHLENAHAINREKLMKSLLISFRDDLSTNLVDYKKINFTSFRGKNTGGSYDDYKFYYIPTVRYGFGNCICFEFAFDSPMSAGLQTSAKSGWFGTSDYTTYTVNYTDDNGFVDYAQVRLYLNLPFTNDTLSTDFPVLSAYLASYSNYALIDLNDYKVKKQPNEIFALNYQLAFLPYVVNQDFIGTKLINDNFLTLGERKQRKLYICLKTKKSSILDVREESTDYFLKREVYSGAFNVDANDRTSLTFYYLSLNQDDVGDTVSWSLVNENDEILFASNTQPGQSSVTINLLLRHSRL